MNMNLALGKSMRWWEKGLQPNMREIESAQDLVDALTNAGDRLVVVDFFSPGCGGCRAFHPKVRGKSIPNSRCMIFFIYPRTFEKIVSFLRNLFRADLSICGAESRCAVLASELRGAQVYVPQPSCPCPTLVQILQGSTGTTL